MNYKKIYPRIVTSWFPQRFKQILKAKKTFSQKQKFDIPVYIYIPLVLYWLAGFYNDYPNNSSGTSSNRSI